MTLRLEWEKLAGLALVAILHIAALWGLWTHRLIPTPQETMTLFVDFITPPTPPKATEPPRREPPKPRPEEKPQARQLVAEAPVSSPADVVAPAPLPAPVLAPAESRPAAPVNLGAELAVSCPERTAPAYPLMSRRMGETGTTVLRVELDEQGHVSSARVATGSGFPRLDDAALAAVKSWRCTPAQRNGQPTRAVALQPFKFLLQGN